MKKVNNRRRDYIQSVWTELERQSNSPRFVTGIVKLEWQTFASAIDHADLREIAKYLDLLHSGKVIVLQNAYSKEDCEQIIKSCINWTTQQSESFSPTVDGAPDFYQSIDVSQASKSFYSFKRIQRQFYLYRWNNDPYKLFPLADKTWTRFKTMSGWSADEFCANKPSDGVVDRLHIHHYPKGLGEQELHADPPARQKFIQGFNLTTLGEDYYSGGLYFIQGDNCKVFVDEHLTKGDGYIAYPTVIHGVEKIDCQSTPDWSMGKGRWFMGFYSMDSDLSENRNRGWPEKL